MTRAEFATLLRDRLPEYVASASVNRNAHMNQWRGPDPDAALTTALVTHLLDVVDSVPSFLPEFADEMGAAASAIVESAGDDVPPELRKAVLVDYINWIAGRFFGCDLAMYSSDLEDK